MGDGPIKKLGWSDPSFLNAEHSNYVVLYYLPHTDLCQGLYVGSPLFPGQNPVDLYQRFQ